MLTFRETNPGHGEGAGQMFVTGNSINELLEYAMPRIRRQSKEFYEQSIQEDLKAKGTTLIDQHAIGIMTRMSLRDSVSEREYSLAFDFDPDARQL